MFSTYVLEYLLGQYCATSDEPTIQTGIETVKEILAKNYMANKSFSRGVETLGAEVSMMSVGNTQQAPFHGWLSPVEQRPQSAMTFCI